MEKKVKKEMNPEVLVANPVKKERVRVVVDNPAENPVKTEKMEKTVMTEPKAVLVVKKEREKVLVDNPVAILLITLTGLTVPVETTTLVVNQVATQAVTMVVSQVVLVAVLLKYR